jgi:hypothetical protein
MRSGQPRFLSDFQLSKGFGGGYSEGRAQREFGDFCDISFVRQEPETAESGKAWPSRERFADSQAPEPPD